MSKSGHAKFWALDLHTHTPASRDVNATRYGAATPEHVVAAAIAAGLDAIAVTDHNTSAWCEKIATAAAGTSLLVLPGVEISTAEGHLLAVWEENTPESTINDLLVRLGIKTAEFGKLDIAAEFGFAKAALEVHRAGGIAIAAHIDRPKGLLQLTVAAHVKKTLLEPCLCAVEIVDRDTAKEVANKVGGQRPLACVRGSDAMMSGSSVHVIAGIGGRRTWIKAARPDLVGLKHALEDPELRVRLDEPAGTGLHPAMESVALSGGFLSGEHLDLSRDLNCLLGGTGAGKSLILESIRFCLEQQVDRSAFPTIWAEVASRLNFGLGSAGVVTVVVSTPAGRFMIERPLAADGRGQAQVYQDVDGSWTEVDMSPAKVLPIVAFSQGEVLEFSREPVGRMSLVDSSIDFNSFCEDALVDALSLNASRFLDQRRRVSGLKAAVGKETEAQNRVTELSALFDTKVVKQQEGWKKEGAKFSRVRAALPSLADIRLTVPSVNKTPEIPSNKDVFDGIDGVLSGLRVELETGRATMQTAIDKAAQKIERHHTTWNSRFGEFKQQLDDELAKVKDGSSLVTLRAQLERLQEELVDIRSKKTDLEDVEAPKLTTLGDEREALLAQLAEVRDTRRKLRRSRAAELNAKTAKIVKLDISKHADHSAFREALESLKVGSRVSTEVLDAIAGRIHPFRFVRTMLSADVTDLAMPNEGIDAASIARLYANIEDRDLWETLLKTQVCPMPDRLDVKFRKPDDGSYAPIEQLAHGQRCTAILVVLLADGTAPVVVDQPEDALHAPWIEEYLVDRLRGLRGERQYIFATRSPGIVVGADAEQIVTMRATVGRGEIEATGSLERHDLNRLTLHHLEGGPVPFKRRSGKLRVSVDS